MSKTTTITMDELLAGSDIKHLETGDVVEGTVSSVKKHEVWIDLGASGVGVVMRREIGHGQVLVPGQQITVSVIEPELEEGYALLSMKRAAKDRGWDERRPRKSSEDALAAVPGVSERLFRGGGVCGGERPPEPHRAALERGKPLCAHARRRPAGRRDRSGHRRADPVRAGAAGQQRAARDRLAGRDHHGIQGRPAVPARRSSAASISSHASISCACPA